LAVRLATESRLPHVELDLLRYRSNWREVPTGEFIDQVGAATQAPCWIIDGNYSAVRNLTWSRADLVVWLDYSLPVILYRLLTRTIHRLFTKANIGNENREQLLRVLGRRSILLWAIRSHAPLRKEYEIMVKSLHSDAPYVIRHRSPKETRVWLSEVHAVGPGSGADDEDEVTGISWATADRY